MRKLLAFTGLAMVASAAMALTTQGASWHGNLAGVHGWPAFSGQKFTNYPLTSGGPHPIKGTLTLATATLKTGGQIFLYRIFNDKDSGVPITQFFLRRFPNGQYTIDWDNNSPGNVAPTFVSGSQGVGGDGYYTTFQFGTPIQPGQSSRFFFITTDAPAFEMTNAEAYVNGVQTNSNHIAIPVPAMSVGKP